MVDVNEHFGPDSKTINDDLTGFPVPDLVRGGPVPLVNVDDIVQCPYIQPTNLAPDEDNTTPVYFTMRIDRLLDIDHIKETVSVFAIFMFTWPVRTCPATIVGSHAPDLERVFVADEKLIWKPEVLFQNSSHDIKMKSNKFGSEMQVLYIPTTPNRTLFFYWTRAGILTSKCTLNVKYFPYDEQTCDFYFEIRQPNDFVRFGGIYLSQIQISKDSFWIYQGGINNTGLTRSTLIKDAINSFAFISLKFRRNPYFYVYTLLAPCLILFIALLVSFLMPPHRSERSLLCCTLVLAFSMARGTILDEVPETSQKIIFSDFMLSIEVISAIVTLYNMLMLTISKKKRNFRLAFKVKFLCIQISMIKAIEIFTLFLFLSIFFIVVFGFALQFLMM